MTEVEVLDSSPVAQRHNQLFALLKPALSIDVGKSIAIPKNGLDRTHLVGMANSLSNKEKRIVVIEHPTVFEIARIEDHMDLRFFYKTIVNENKEVSAIDETQQVVLTKRAIKSYIVAPWSSLTSYCVGIPQVLHQERIVPYAYLQRKLSCIAVFRKDPIGATSALNRAIKFLINESVLSEIPKPVMNKEFHTNSRAFRIDDLRGID